MKDTGGIFVRRYSLPLSLAVLAVFLGTEVPLLAQIGYPGGGYPGGYPPYPGGGGYPPYGYPGGGPGVGMPMPRRGGRGRVDPNAAITIYRGKIKRIDDKNLTMDLDDGRTLDMKNSGRTRFYKDSKEVKAPAFNVGDHVAVDATEDQQGFLYAVKVTFERAATADEQKKDSSDTAKNTGSLDEDRPKLKRAPATDNAESQKDSASAAPPAANQSDTTQAGAKDSGQQQADSATQQPPDFGKDGPPPLKRGAPAAKPQRADAPTAAAQPAPQQTASAAPPAAPSQTAPQQRVAARSASPDGGRITTYPDGDPFIEKAREATFTFSTKLPNFICQEFMARFARDSGVRGWQSLDVVSAEIIYDAGQESYRNLKINGTPTVKKMEELSGSWSTGEFATTLNDLFHPNTRARFRFGEEGKIAGIAARIYDFDVEKVNSHWIVQMGSQQLAPAYKGSVWIDKENGRVLRIEMQARDLPGGFPMDIVESAVDYSFVRIGTESVLLPVHAESLGCQRGTQSCSRNVIDFRNYRKYSADSKIIFDQDQ